MRRLDEDALLTVAYVLAWPPGAGDDLDLQNGAEWLRDAMTTACNMAMPRVTTKLRREVYWWCEELVARRERVIRARHRYTRACRTKERQEEEESAPRLEL